MAKWKRRLRRKRRSRRYVGGSAKLKRSKRIAKIAKLAFIGVILFFLALFVIIPLFAFNLPSPDRIVRKEGFSTKILDRNGEVLYDIFAEQKRTPIELEEVPQHLRNATIAVEDKNFYKHSGFDPSGIFRAMFNIVFRGKLQGGSTCFCSPLFYHLHAVPLTSEWLHLDCVLAIIRQGLCMACKSAFKNGLPEYFKGWEVIEASAEEAHHLGVNTMCLEENKVLIGTEFGRIIDELKKHGADVLTTPTHIMSNWGGGIRCSTHPILRDK